MIRLKKTALYIIIALLTALLFGCGGPAAEPEEVEKEELQEDIEENDEDVKEEEKNNQEEENNGSDPDNGSDSSGTTGSGFSHTVEMNINGEVKEGEGEEWWIDEEGGNDDEWWDD